MKWPENHPWEAGVEALTNSLVDVHYMRSMARRTMEAFDGHRSLWIGWFARLYGEALSMTIRRLVDDQPKSTGFLALLNDLRNRTDELAALFVAKKPPLEWWRQNQWF